jgi:hypothetical protein
LFPDQRTVAVAGFVDAIFHAQKSAANEALSICREKILPPMHFLLEI